jgi:hypothetical protein
MAATRETARPRDSPATDYPSQCTAGVMMHHTQHILREGTLKTYRERLHVVFNFFC